MTPASRHSALRFALRSMLADLTYPEVQKSQPWVEARLGEAAWPDTLVAQLTALAVRWASTQGARVALQLRKALGEALTEEETAVLEGPASRPSTFAQLTDSQGETMSIDTMPPNGKELRDAMDTTHGTTDTALVELHRQYEYMQAPPYNTPPKKLDDALKACQAGKVREATDAENVWEVQGSKGTWYSVTTDGCACPHGQHTTKTKWGCYHAVAVELYRRWQRELQPELFGRPKTADERLAQTPPKTADVAPQHANAPQDDAQDVGRAQGAVSGQKQEKSMAPADTFTPEPAAPRRSVLTLALPRRSISAIVADLSRPLPDTCLVTIKRDGRDIPGLHWYTVRAVLDTYAPGWQTRITILQVDKDVCRVVCRLGIPCLEGIVWREGTGEKDDWDADPKQYGNPAANAEANAFKRAASKFGVGTYLYERDQTSTALQAYLKEEKTTALVELGKLADEAELPRESVITWLKAQTGAQTNAHLPLWAIRALMSHLRTVGKA